MRFMRHIFSVSKGTYKLTLAPFLSDWACRFQKYPGRNNAEMDSLSCQCLTCEGFDRLTRCASFLCFLRGWERYRQSPKLLHTLRLVPFGRSSWSPWPSACDHWSVLSEAYNELFDWKTFQVLHRGLTQQTCSSAIYQEHQRLTYRARSRRRPPWHQHP